MVMVPVERLMARRQVDAEIKSDPVSIILSRRTKIETPDGGWKWGPNADLSPQSVLIMPAKRRLSDMWVNTELGDITKYPFILLGRHSLDLLQDDTFYWDNSKFQVKSIYIKTQVSITAQIDYFGKETTLVGEGTP